MRSYIQTAFGCVEEMFMSVCYEVEPDIITFGKSIGGGFPLAGLLYGERFSFKPGQHSFTFGHSPISFTAGKAFLIELQKEVGKANKLSDYICESLMALQKKHKIIGEVRCIGTKAAFDVKDGSSERNCKAADIIVEEMFERGVIISASRYKLLGESIMLQAPLVSTLDDLRSAFGKLDVVLDKFDEQKSQQRSAMLAI